MKYRAGFTLIELMVVLIIIGLFAGMVTLNIGPNQSKLVARESKRLYQVLQLAQDEAIMQGIEIGFTLANGQYSFSRLKGAEWLPLTADKQLSEHNFGSEIDMVMLVENEKTISQVNEGEAITPLVMLLSSGEITAFEIDISGQDDNEVQFKINAQDSGVITFYDPNHDK